MKPDLSPLRRRYAEANSPTFRIAANALAEGIQGGLHRSSRKGSGIEFAGHRPYTPGDDLRHLDRHALLRHGRLLLREFHSETERALHLIVDASPSMSYRSQPAPVSKLRAAALLSAALAFSAKRVGDPVGLSIIGGTPPFPTALPRLGGEAIERVLGRLEELDGNPDNQELSQPVELGQVWRRTLSEVGARTPRGAVIVVLSDLLDMDAELTAELGRLCTKRRRVLALQVLDPFEVDFPFEGSLVLRDSETISEVETDAQAARQAYLDRLAQLTDSVVAELRARGGQVTRALTTEPPADSLRRLLETRGDR